MSATWKAWTTKWECGRDRRVMPMPQDDGLIVRPFDSTGMTSGSWHFAGRSRGMFQQYVAWKRRSVVRCRGLNTIVRRLSSWRTRSSGAMKSASPSGCGALLAPGIHGWNPCLVLVVVAFNYIHAAMCSEGLKIDVLSLKKRGPQTLRPKTLFRVGRTLRLDMNLLRGSRIVYQIRRRIQGATWRVRDAKRVRDLHSRAKLGHSRLERESRHYSA